MTAPGQYDASTQASLSHIEDADATGVLQGDEQDPTCAEAGTYEVEALLEYKYSTAHGDRWLVKWHGYGDGHNSWVLLRDLMTCDLREQAIKLKEKSQGRKHICD
jgi:hypothetical protein